MPHRLCRFFIDQMHAAGEILIRLQRNREGQHQRRRAVELNFRGIQQR
jgi:hypothetical protein